VNVMTKTMTTTTNTTNNKKLNLLNYSRYSTFPCSSREEWSNVHHATAYLDIIDAVPHRTEGEAVLLEHIPINAKRALDLGTGNGRLLKMIKANRPNIRGVGLDISPTMLKVAQEGVAVDKSIQVIEHDLNNSLLPLLSELGTFDVIVTSLTIHHLTHKRKRSIYEEIFSLLNRGGIFCNLEHVDSPTSNLHEHFLNSIGDRIASFARDENSDRLLSLETQLDWLRQIGFVDVDCYWKWLELALLIGIKP
jgi:tRNA (cmo5U34)-methyltransferase